MRVNNNLHIQRDISSNQARPAEQRNLAVAARFSVDDMVDLGNEYRSLPSNIISEYSQNFQAASANTGTNSVSFRDGDEFLFRFANPLFGNVLGRQEQIERAAAMLNMRNPPTQNFQVSSSPTTVFSPQDARQFGSQNISGRAFLEISRFLAANYIDESQAAGFLIQHGIQNLETVQVTPAENGNGYNGENGNNGDNGTNGVNGYNGNNGPSGDSIEPPPRARYSYAPPTEDFSASQNAAQRNPEQQRLNDLRSFFDFPDFSEEFMAELLGRMFDSQQNQQDNGWLTNMWATVGASVGAL